MTEVIKQKARRGWVLPRGLDRPIVGVVGVDPAYVGKGGLCVLPRASLKPGAQLAWRNGQLMEEATFKWLGEACAALCRPGERLLLVALSTAFRSRAWMLGKSVGAMEGLLTNLHAMEPGTLVEVADVTVRQALWTSSPRGRDAIKRKAIRYVREKYGLEMPDNAAEATMAATYGLQQLEAPANV